MQPCAKACPVDLLHCGLQVDDPVRISFPVHFIVPEALAPGHRTVAAQEDRAKSTAFGKRNHLVGIGGSHVGD